MSTSSSSSSAASKAGPSGAGPLVAGAAAAAPSGGSGSQSGPTSGSAPLPSSDGHPRISLSSASHTGEGKGEKADSSLASAGNPSLPLPKPSASKRQRTEDRDETLARVLENAEETAALREQVRQLTQLLQHNLVLSSARGPLGLTPESSAPPPMADPDPFDDPASEDEDENGEAKVEDPEAEGKDEGKEGAWWMVSDPTFFPPSYSGPKPEPKPGSSADEVAAARASKAAFDACLPFISHTRRKAILASSAHPLTTEFCANIPQLYRVSETAFKGWHQQAVLAAGHDAITRLSGVMDREQDVLRMVSSLYAAVDESTSVDDIKDALRNVALIIVHNQNCTDRMQYGWHYHNSTGTPAPKAAASEQAHNFELLSAHPDFAQIEANKATAQRVAALAKTTTHGPLPFFDSVDLDSWPFHNALSHRTHSALAHIPSGFDAATRARPKTGATRGRGRGAARGSHSAGGSYYASSGGSSPGGAHTRASGRTYSGRGRGSHRGRGGRGARGAHRGGSKAASEASSST